MEDWDTCEEHVFELSSKTSANEVNEPPWPPIEYAEELGPPELDQPLNEPPWPPIEYPLEESVPPGLDPPLNKPPRVDISSSNQVCITINSPELKDDGMSAQSSYLQPIPDQALFTRTASRKRRRHSRKIMSELHITALVRTRCPVGREWELHQRSIFKLRSKTLTDEQIAFLKFYSNKLDALLFAYESAWLEAPSFTDLHHLEWQRELERVLNYAQNEACVNSPRYLRCEYPGFRFLNYMPTQPRKTDFLDEIYVWFVSLVKRCPSSRQFV